MIVEDVLGQARTRTLWTANYYPVLPFTPQSFEVGALLPTMLYMARFGHRRGKGRFEQVFGRGPNGSVRAPTVNDVAAVLATDRKGDLQGFEDDIGRTVLGDLLLSWCLENRKHVEGQQEQVQRILPTHYFASWVDLPENVASLRGVPEFLTALLARQVDGAWLRQGEPGPFPVGVADLNESRLLALFSRHCAIRGKHAADLASDTFVEDQAHNIGIDELLAVRIALACSNAPHPIGTDGEIANRMPLARRAADGLRDDLSVFVTVYGSQIPRQAFLRMVEAGTGLGLLNLLLSTVAILDEWELTGEVPRVENQSPLPLFVDASQGQDATLRELSEASMTECLRRFERAPILLMLLRVLDDRARNDRRLADKLPPSEPDASDYIRLLGDIYKERHPRSESIFDNLFEDSRRLAAELENDQPEVAERLRHGDPMALAESLCELMGRTLQMNQFLRALESTLMTDKPNGLAVRRRISRTVNGRRRSLDVRSIVLSSAVLDFLVHRHLRDGVDDESSRTLTLRHFLDLLRDRYGLFVDQEPPGQLIPRELLLKNKAWLERRLRDLGLLIGVNDAESMKQLRPRYQGAASHVD
jgi:hypothetical protein